jgi:hypothetical protein
MSLEGSCFGNLIEEAKQRETDLENEIANM